MKKWIPTNSLVIQNSSDPIVNRHGNKPESKINLLLLSRDSKGKGHEFSINVIQELLAMGVDTELVMTGKSVIATNATTLPIVYHGWVSPEDRAKMIAEADFLIQPSEFEGSSMSVIESMVSGLPAIVSRASSETVGIDELVLPLDSPKEWAERIAELVDAEKYFRLVEETLEQAARFSTDKSKKRWGEVYDNLFLESYNGN